MAARIARAIESLAEADTTIRTRFLHCLARTFYAARTAARDESVDGDMLAAVRAAVPGDPAALPQAGKSNRSS